MKILVVSQYYWPENFRINDLTTGLLERGHEVTVLTGIPNYPDGKFPAGYGWFGRRYDNYKGAKIVRVPLVARGSGGKIRMILNFLSFAFFASMLGPVLCREHYDIIFVFEPSPITVGLPARVMKFCRRCPIVFWVQDLWPESLVATGTFQSEFILKKVENLVRFIYNGCDLILTSSRSYISSIQSYNVPADRVRYFPQSVEDIYRPIDSKCSSKEKALLPDGFLVMFAGNIGVAQSFETILSAAEYLKDDEIKFVIIGDGRRFQWLKDEVEHKGLQQKIYLLGRHPLETMPAFFSCADALLVTLKRDPVFALTVPGKVQSYFACGKPIIAALEGEGARMVLESGAGLVSEPEDGYGLASSIRELMARTPDQRKIIGRAGLTYYKEHFSREMLLGRLDKWMTELRSTS